MWILGREAHVIQAPAKSRSLFFNYKKTFSIVLLTLVDANYRFIAVDIGSYGRQSDGRTLKNSILGQKLEKNELDFPDDADLPHCRALTCEFY